MAINKFNLKIKKKILPFKYTIKIDSDKSISIRSFLIAAISQNLSVASNVLEFKMSSTINCLKKLGVKIKNKTKNT